MKLHPNETRDIPCYIDKEVDYPATAAKLLEAGDSCVAEWLDVEPSVINYRFMLSYITCTKIGCCILCG